MFSDHDETSNIATVSREAWMHLCLPVKKDQMFPNQVNSLLKESYFLDIIVS